MSEIDIRDVLDQVGMSPDRKVSDEELALYLMPASIDAFADGELMVAHKPIADDELKKYYGELYFRDGLVSQRLGAAAIVNGMKPGNFTNYQRLVGGVFIDMLPTLEFPQEVKSGVVIVDDGIEFDGQNMQLPRSVKTVVDYGPGMAGLSHTKTQAQLVAQGILPYRYMPITRLPFTNAALINSYDAWLGNGAAAIFLNKRCYIGREDGIKSATNELVALGTAATGSAEIADLVIASGLSKADRDEVKTGIDNSHKILKEGGALVIRSMAEPSSDEIGAPEMIDWAYEAGFPEDKAVKFDAITGAIGAALLGQPRYRKAISAVLIK